MFSLPDWLRSKPKQLTEANQKPASELDAEPVAKVGTNIDRPVINLYRPHITSGDCLIVTGYQDFLSSLSILMKDLPELKDPENESDIRIRISFWIDTANTKRLTNPKPVTEEMTLYWLERSGLQVEEDHDLLAVLAKHAIQTGKIDLRVFDPELAKRKLGISGVGGYTQKSSAHQKVPSPGPQIFPTRGSTETLNMPMAWMQALMSFRSNEQKPLSRPGTYLSIGMPKRWRYSKSLSNQLQLKMRWRIRSRSKRGSNLGSPAAEKRSQAIRCLGINRS